MNRHGRLAAAMPHLIEMAIECGKALDALPPDLDEEDKKSSAAIWDSSANTPTVRLEGRS